MTFLIDPAHAGGTGRGQDIDHTHSQLARLEKRSGPHESIGLGERAYDVTDYPDEPVLQDNNLFGLIGCRDFAKQSQVKLDGVADVERLAAALIGPVRDENGDFNHGYSLAASSLEWSPGGRTDLPRSSGVRPCT
jgi:hypothetical protein